MDFNTTVDLIIRELNEAAEIIEDLKSYRNVPFLQVELAKSKCRNAAEVIRLLKNLQDNSPEINVISGQKVTPVNQATEKQEPEVKQQAKQERKPEPEVKQQAKPERKPEPEVKQQVKPERKPEQGPEIRRQENVKTKEEAVGISRKKSESVTLGDTFSQRADSLNEKLGIRKEDDDVADYLKSKPITRLSEAIGINDKFLFIRELFNGNSELYNKTISSLDNTGTFSDARTIVMNIAGNVKENKVARQLLELVKRKFPSDE